MGSVLGQILVLIYVNDIWEKIDASVTVRLFADNCQMCNTIGTHEDQYRSNTALESLIKWCNRWDIKINSEKLY